jgi:hypothetical protein
MIVFATGLIVYRFSFDHDAIIAKKKTAAILKKWVAFNPWKWEKITQRGNYN